MKNIARIAVLFCSIGAAHAAEPTQELGVPLGKKMAMPIQLCPEQGAGGETAPCWVKSPRVLDDAATAGTLKVPASVEGWAAPGVYQVRVDRNGVLRSVGVLSSRSNEFAKISDALSARFGGPAGGARREGRYTSASWHWNDAVIDLACIGESGCVTNFSLKDRGVTMRRHLDNNPFLLSDASDKLQQRSVR